jgi:hypothetical protein
MGRGCVGVAGAVALGVGGEVIPLRTDCAIAAGPAAHNRKDTNNESGLFFVLETPIPDVPFTAHGSV